MRRSQVRGSNSGHWRKHWWQFLNHLFMPQCVSQTCVLLQSPYRLYVEFVGLRPLAESMRLDLISLVTVCGGLPISFAISGMERPRRSPSSMLFLSTMVICAMSFLLS